MSHTAETLLLAIFSIIGFINGVYLVKMYSVRVRANKLRQAILEGVIILLRKNGVGSDEIDKVREMVVD